MTSNKDKIKYLVSAIVMAVVLIGVALSFYTTKFNDADKNNPGDTIVPEISNAENPLNAQ